MPSPHDHASYGGAAGDLPGSLRAAEHPARGLQQRPLREADGGRARPEDAGPGLETIRRGGQGDR